MIQGCIKNRLYDKAWEVYDRCRIFYSIQPDLITYTQMIYICSQEDKPEKAMNLFDELSTFNIRPNRRIYNTIIYCCSKSYEYEAAAFLFYDRMKANKIIPNIYTLNILLHSCTVRGDINRAESIMNDFKIYHIQPDKRTYCELLNTYGKSCLLGLPPNIEVDLLTRYDKSQHRPLPSYIKDILKRSDITMNLEKREEIEESIIILLIIIYNNI